MIIQQPDWYLGCARMFREWGLFVSFIYPGISLLPPSLSSWYGHNYSSVHCVVRTTLSAVQAIKSNPPRSNKDVFNWDWHCMLDIEVKVHTAMLQYYFANMTCFWECIHMQLSGISQKSNTIENLIENYIESLRVSETRKYIFPM